MPLNLSDRNQQSELMDDPSIDDSSHRQALSGLRRINRWSRTDAAVWNIIQQLARQRTPDRPLTILDIASGGGDLAIRLAKTARLAKLSVTIDGCDISPTAISFATEQAAVAHVSGVRFYLCNALDQPFPKPHYDVVMCSLFMHHLTSDDSVRLLRRMKDAATQLVLVDDLRRTRLGYWMAWIGCRVLTRCRVVHIDGPMSVEGAFTIDEARSIAEKAELDNSTIQRHWPQRFVLTWKPASGDPDATS